MTIAVIITALVGYAIGTAQVLLLDWVRSRRLHSTQLRVIRAELRRALGLNQKFNWDEEGPKDDSLPNPPTVSSKYADLVTSIDLLLTDEHEDDNTQVALLEVLDGCKALRDIITEVEQILEEIPAGPDELEKARLRDNAKEYVLEYSKTHDKLMLHLRSGIDDVNRRLKEVKLRKQLKRQFKRLPPAPESTQPYTAKNRD